MTATLTKEAAENRILLANISWETFNKLLEELGNKRCTRLTYFQGELEIMTPLWEHENNNRFIDDLIRAIADELNLNMKKVGSLTLKLNKKQKGVEPDSCYYLKNEPLVRNKQNIDLENDPAPDLVLEIDLTSGSLNKLPIYAAMKIPEIWRYNRDKLTVFVLNEDSESYIEVYQSPTFPWLNLDLIPQLIKESWEIGETSTLKKFRQYVRNNINK
jgi:Uma2 family endonuclease